MSYFEGRILTRQDVMRIREAYTQLREGDDSNRLPSEFQLGQDVHLHVDEKSVPCTVVSSNFSRIDGVTYDLAFEISGASGLYVVMTSQRGFITEIGGDTDPNGGLVGIDLPDPKPRLIVNNVEER